MDHLKTEIIKVTKSLDAIWCCDGLLVDVIVIYSTLSLSPSYYLQANDFGTKLI